MPMHYAPQRKLPFPMPPVRTPPSPKALVERAGSLVHTTFSLAGLRPARGRRVRRPDLACDTEPNRIENQ